MSGSEGNAGAGLPPGGFPFPMGGMPGGMPGLNIEALQQMMQVRARK